MDAAEVGWILAHELGHLAYGLTDEYDTDSLDLVCVGEYDNDGTPETSMMAARHRSHWCDSDTHVHVRNVKDIDDQQIPINSGSGLLTATLPSYIHQPDGTSTNDVWNYVLAVSNEDWGDDYQLSYSKGDYATAPPFPGVDPIEFCDWLTDGGTLINDANFIIDKSGSMGYVDPDFAGGPTAFEGAYATARSMYISLDSDYQAGIIAYDTIVDELVEYGPIGPPPPEDPLISAGGNTDICLAISASAQAISDAGGDDSYGQQILLSDGLPTAAGCNNAESVLAAAVEACQGAYGGVPTVTHTLAFGNADADLLRQVSETCGGLSGKSMTLPSPGGLTAPLVLSSGIARLGNHTHGLHEVAFTNDRVHEPRTDYIQVPEGSTELVVRWFGDGFSWYVFADNPLWCEMSQLDFFLLSPSGVSHPISVVGETARSVQVNDPEPGQWRAVIVPKDPFICTAEASDSTPGTPQWGDYDPRVTSIAAVRHGAFDAALWTDANTVGRDRPIKIFGRLTFLQESVASLTTLLAIAPAAGGSITFLAMNDAGSDGDEQAGDGIFTTTFNPGGGLLPVADNYVVRAQFLSQTGVSQTVPHPTDPVVAGVLVNEPARAVPTALLTAETSFTIANCTGPDCFVTTAFPALGSSYGACTVKPTVGTTTNNLTVETRGLRLVDGMTTVRLVPGTDTSVSNVQILSYDAGTREGLVSFDATLTANASDQPRRIIVSSAGRSIDSLECEDDSEYWDLPLTCIDDPTVANCCEDGMVIIEGTSSADLLVHSPSVPVAACILGYDDHDDLQADPPADHIFVGGFGDDEILANGGDDRVVGGPGIDTIYTQGGNDTIFAGGGADIVFAGDGDDRIDGGDDADELTGGLGGDTIEGGIGDDLIFGLDNSDLIYPGAGADIVDAGSGDDRVHIRARCELGSKYLEGGLGSDTLILPVSLALAQSQGLVAVGFEQILENVLSQVGSEQCE